MRAEDARSWMDELERLDSRLPGPQEEPRRHRLTKEQRAVSKDSLHRAVRTERKVEKVGNLGVPQDAPRAERTERRVPKGRPAAMAEGGFLRRAGPGRVAPFEWERGEGRDAAARARVRGESSLLPNEEPYPGTRRDYERVLRRRDPSGGRQRGSEYSKPYPPSAGFVRDSILPTELTMRVPGGYQGGAPDFRYGDAAFANTQERFMAEQLRTVQGAPPLNPWVDPSRTGNMPTYLEQALLARRAAGLFQR